MTAHYLKTLLPLMLWVLLTLPTFAATAITGEAYRDFNNSGTRDTLVTYNEPPVAGVTVTVFSTDGSVVDSDITDANGQYTLNVPDALDGERLRIEFTNLPDDLQPGTHTGAGEDGLGTTVRFITGGIDVTVDLPLSSRGDFCGTGTNPQPDLVTSCFVFNDQTTTDPTVVLFNYGDRGDGVAYTELANATESGTVYGFGYHNPTNVIFFANYVRRHAGTTPNGGAAGNNLDTLYAYNINGDTLTTFDMGALGAANFGSDGRTPGWNFDSESDTDNWDMVGKVGAGDVELSSDNSTLYVTNLNARRVEIFNLEYGNATAAGGYMPGIPTVTHVGALGPFNPGCTNGVARPFAIGYRDGQVYTGVVCTAENGGTSADLSAHIYRGNTLVFSMDLAFAATPNHRGCAGVGTNPDCIGGGAGNHYGDWNPWSDSFAFNASAPPDVRGLQISRPEPILTDIEFDSAGNMILGFRDRFGDMVGVNSLSDPGSPQEYSSWAAGDLIRVCDVGGTYVLEGDASGLCPQNAANNDGPNGGEFYVGDNAVGGFHGEATQGALVHVRGTDRIVTSFLDPLDDIFSGGFRWISNIDGSSTAADGLELFFTPPGAPSSGGKGNGLGDIEALCPPPPLEIGNLVWIEDVRDGIQGTDVETPVNNVLLELLDPTTGNVIAQTNTDPTGHYYFNTVDAIWDTNNDGIFGDQPPLWDINGNGIVDPNEPAGIMPNTRYTVRVADSNFDPGQPLEDYFQTAVNVGSGFTENGFLMSDSEGLSVTITTGTFGVNNHTLDFGFTLIPPPNPQPPAGQPGDGQPVASASGNPTINKTVDNPFALPNDTVTWTIRVENPTDTPLPNVSFTDQLPDELELLSAVATTGDVVIDGQTIRYSIAQLSPAQVVTVTVSTRVRPSTTVPYVLVNNARFDAPYQGQSNATLISITRLPDTGEVLISSAMRLLLIALAVVGLGTLARAIWARVR
ncbi:MAG: SdrD B-like domain-containing protein [Anaerolineae bacterium]